MPKQTAGAITSYLKSKELLLFVSDDGGALDIGVASENGEW